MNIDNLSSLILSVYNNKGVYALLLGSGISLEAKIMYPIIAEIYRDLGAVYSNEAQRHDTETEIMKLDN